MPHRTKMIEEDLAIRLPTHEILSTPVTIEAVKFYAQQGKEMKSKIDTLAAEVTHRQQKIKFIQEIMQELNNSIDSTGKLDITQKPELLEKLRVAKEMGTSIPMDAKSTDSHPLCKSKFSSDEKDRLIQNLGLSIDTWDKENKQHTQRMQIYLEESNRYLTLATQAMKYEDKPKRNAISSMGK